MTSAIIIKLKPFLVLNAKNRYYKEIFFYIQAKTTVQVRLWKLRYIFRGNALNNPFLSPCARLANHKEFNAMLVIRKAKVV